MKFAVGFQLFGAKDVPFSELIEPYKDSIVKVVVESGITSVGRCSFYGFTSITEVSLPETIVSIDEYAFYGCTALESFTVPASTRTLGQYALRRSGVKTVIFEKADEWKLDTTWFETDYVADAAGCR